jgi:hypothetical protein
MSILGALRKVTGGAADVDVTIENAVRGGKAKVTVDVKVGSAAVKAKRVYVRLTASEVVDIPRYTAPSQPGATGGSNIIHVQSSVEVFSHEFDIAGAQELAAGSTQQFIGEIDVPKGPLASFTGQTMRMHWQTLAGLDVAWSTDPSSGWVDVVVT